MAFTARANQGSADAGKDAIPITASSTTNVFGETFNPTNGPASAARACKALLADSDMTITCYTAAGKTRSNLFIAKGYNPIQVIQVSAISAGNLWAIV